MVEKEKNKVVIDLSREGGEESETEEEVMSIPPPPPPEHMTLIDLSSYVMNFVQYTTGGGVKDL